MIQQSHPNPETMQPRAFTTFVGDTTVSSDDEADVSTILSLSRRKRRRTMAQAPSVHRRGSLTQIFATRAPHSPVLGVGPGFDVENNDRPFSSPSQRRRSVELPESDRQARQRCFDYLLMAIDAVWAEYCDSTSQAETEMYQFQCAPDSPRSDEEIFGSSGSVSPRALVSMQADARRLMRLKKRLMDAKYAMTDLVNRADPDSSSRFWKTWDVLKHEVVEHVEGDDDDAQEVLMDLEVGRY